MLRIDDITLPFEGIHDSTLNYFVLNICLNRCGCKVLFLRHFPKGDFPSDNFLSGNFPNVQFLKRQLPKGQVMPLMCRREPSAAARQSGGRGCQRCGLDRLGKLPLGKLHIWEVLPPGKIPLGSCHLCMGHVTCSLRIYPTHPSLKDLIRSDRQTKIKE